MANELTVVHLLNKNVYAIIRRRSNAYIWDVGHSALEMIGTWNDARVDECDIALTDKEGGLYAADFPAACITAAIYFVLYFERAGASPDTTDRLIGRSFIVWDGTKEITINDINKLLRADKVVDTTKTPWVTDYKEEGTATKLLSKTMKNTDGVNVTSKNNVLGQLVKE